MPGTAPALCSAFLSATTTKGGSGRSPSVSGSCRLPFASLHLAVAAAQLDEQYCYRDNSSDRERRGQASPASGYWIIAVLG